MKVVWLFGTAIAVFVLVVVSSIPMPTKLIYNGSRSAPIGFYWIDQQPINHGDYVLAHVPNRIRNLVEKRHYLPPDVPLIKRVAGVEGDTICRRDLEIIIDGVTVAMARNTDNLGRTLPDWQGCQTMTASYVFLLQDHHLSFDSRYFGPVRRSLIAGRAVKLRLPWQVHAEN